MSGTNVSTPIDSSYKLVFDDEFNGTSVDTSNWSVLNQPLGGGYSGIDYFSPSNATVSNGLLNLTVTRGSPDGLPYSAGFVHTPRSFQYGYFEIRAEMPSNGAGNWPAFWMNASGTFPEIDVLEWLGNGPGTQYQTYHPSNDAALTGGTGFDQPYSNGTDWSSGYHVYGMLWTPTSISWYVDGAKTFTVTNGEVIGGKTVSITSAGMQVILNSAIGGWNSNSVNSSSVFPSDYKVDYVHIYQTNGTAVTPEAGYGGPGSTGGTVVIPPPSGAPSASDTVVNAGSNAAITDGSGNLWTITSGGQVAVNGVADAATSGVIELAYVNGTVWQENNYHLWWGKTSPTASWSPPYGTPTSPLPAASPDTVMVRMSEDAYHGDAQFTVRVDGQQVGGTLTASALHATGDSNVFILTGNWGAGLHDVQIQLLNYAYGGSAATSRDLYVNSIAYNGTTYSGTSAALLSNGSHDFMVGGSTPTASAPNGTLILHLAEDAWNGDAKFTLSIDGKTITTPQAVTASHSAGAWQDVTIAGNFGAGMHNIGVTFTNDAYGGTSSTDRNLYVGGVDFDGVHYGSGTTVLYSSGTAHFSVG